MGYYPTNAINAKYVRYTVHNPPVKTRLDNQCEIVENEA